MDIGCAPPAPQTPQHLCPTAPLCLMCYRSGHAAKDCPSILHDPDLVENVAQTLVEHCAHMHAHRVSTVHVRAELHVALANIDCPSWDEGNNNKACCMAVLRFLMDAGPQGTHSRRRWRAGRPISAACAVASRAGLLTRKA